MSMVAKGKLLDCPGTKSGPRLSPNLCYGTGFFSFIIYTEIAVK